MTQISPASPGATTTIQSIALDLWDHVIAVWNTTIFEFTTGQLVVTALIIAVGWLARAGLAGVLFVALHKWADKTNSQIDDKIIDSAKGPIKLIPLIIAFALAATVLNLEGQAAAVMANIIRSLIAITIFWAFHNAVAPLMHVAKPLRRTLGDEAMDWLGQGLRILAMFIGAATVLELWGIPVGPIIAGLGIFGVAVALGAQDLFKNLIAGLSILVEKRFAKGDWVLVEGVVEGTVERIHFRSTHIRRFDKSPVYVPNAELSDGAVTNFSRMSHRRIYWRLGLEYRTSAKQLAAIRQKIEDYIFTNPDFAQEPEVTTFVKIDGFAASSIDIMVYAFTNTTRWVEWMQIKQDLLLAIKQIVEDEGAAFAFPSTTLYLEQGDEPPQFYPKRAARRPRKAPPAPTSTPKPAPTNS